MNINELKSLINEFYLNSIKYFGKEILLPSNKLFAIDYLGNDGNMENYRVQYGSKKTGGILMKFSYDAKSNKPHINRFKIYAKPINIRYRLKNDMKLDTNIYSTPEEIIANPNALKILCTSIEDLKKAYVLGDYNLNIGIKSDRMSCNKSIVTKSMPKIH